MENRNQWDSVITVPRHFSGAAVNMLVEQVTGKLKQGEKKLNLDFSGADYIDSFGIGQLIYLAKTMRELRAQLTLSNLNDAIFQLFKDTGLDQVFAIQGVKQQIIDLFESSIDIRLDIAFEEIGDIRVLKMAGVMDHVGGSRFFRQQFLLSLAGYRKILLDLSELTFFDSLSVSAVLDMHKLLRQTGGELKMCGANYLVEDLFKTLNLDALVPFFPTRAEAIDAWK
jgi:anti-sigma B factor antagonist